MWEGNCWKVATQEITQRFPALLHVVHQQLLWWNKWLNTVIVHAITLTQDTSRLGVCRAKNSSQMRIKNKDQFSWSRGENSQKPARYHCFGDLKLIDHTLQPRIFFSFAQNYFTIRESFQYFLPEKISGIVHDRVSILVDSPYIWLGAILENINPVVLEIKYLLFPVKDSESKMPQSFGDGFSSSFCHTYTNYLHDDFLRSDTVLYCISMSGQTVVV